MAVNSFQSLDHDNVRIALACPYVISQQPHHSLSWIHDHLIEKDQDTSALPWAVIIQPPKSPRTEPEHAEPTVALLHSRETDCSCLVQFVVISSFRFNTEENEADASKQTNVALIGPRVANLLHLRYVLRNSAVEAFVSDQGGTVLAFNGGMGALRSTPTLVQIATGGNGGPRTNGHSISSAAFVKASIVRSSHSVNFRSMDEAESVIKNYFTHPKCVESGELVSIPCKYETYNQDKDSPPLYSCSGASCRGNLVIRIQELYVENGAVFQGLVPALGGKVSAECRFQLDGDTCSVMPMNLAECRDYSLVTKLLLSDVHMDRSASLLALTYMLTSSAVEEVLKVLNSTFDIGYTPIQTNRISNASFYSIVRSMLHGQFKEVGNGNVDIPQNRPDTIPVIFLDDCTHNLADKVVSICADDFGVVELTINLSNLIIQALETRGSDFLCIFCELLEHLIKELIFKFSPVLIHIPGIELLVENSRNQGDASSRPIDWSPLTSMIARWSTEPCNLFRSSSEDEHSSASRSPHLMEDLASVEFKPLEEFDQGQFEDEQSIDDEEYNPIGHCAGIIFSCQDKDLIPEELSECFYHTVIVSKDVSKRVDKIMKKLSKLMLLPKLMLSGTYAMSNEVEAQFRSCFAAYGAIPDNSLFSNRVNVQILNSMSLTELIQFVEDCIFTQERGNEVENASVRISEATLIKAFQLYEVCWSSKCYTIFVTWLHASMFRRQILGKVNHPSPLSIGMMWGV